MVTAARLRIYKVVLLSAAVVAAILFYRWSPARQSSAATPHQAPQATAMKVQPPPVQPNTEHDLKMLEKALEKKPGHTPVLMQLAQLEAAKGRLQEAEGHLRQILSETPEDPDARLELGRVLFQRGDIQGALEQTEDILKKNPTNPDALYNIGAIYANIGNRERAAVYWKQLIATDPQSASGKLAQQMLSQLQSPVR